MDTSIITLGIFITLDLIVLGMWLSARYMEKHGAGAH
jgi:uncharacterized protein YneF (UPF0154 family)